MSGTAASESIYLADLTPKEVMQGGFDTAVLPIGATEYHGNHLPYSTDTLMATALAERLAREIGTALVLPPLSYGMSFHLMAWPWTLSVRPQTLTQIVIDIGESLRRHGIDRLLVVSTHDGNPAPVEVAARELFDRHGITVALFAGWQSLSRRLLEGSEFTIDLDHGGQSEMSIVLYLRPDLAHQERAVDLPNERSGHPIRVLGGFDADAPHGYSGPPSKGSAAEGKAILDALAAHVGPFLRDLAANGWRNGSWLSGISRD